MKINITPIQYLEILKFYAKIKRNRKPYLKRFQNSLTKLNGGFEGIFGDGENES